MIYYKGKRSSLAVEVTSAIDKIKPRIDRVVINNKEFELEDCEFVLVVNNNELVCIENEGLLYVYDARAVVIEVEFENYINIDE